MSVIEDAALRDALESALPAGAARRPTSPPWSEGRAPTGPASRSRSWTSSCADGQRLRIMLKDLSHDSLAPDAARAKPRSLHDPLREIRAYRELLADAGLGTPEFYGESTDPATGRHWLFIENVEGDVLWQVGELETWAAAARWLAGLHERFAGTDPLPGFLLRYDRDLWRRWIDARGGLRARRRSAARGAPASASVCCAWPAPTTPVVDRLAALPSTVIHGEFYPSNVLVGHGSDPAARRIAPIDWEVAAAGPGLLDLAALTTGWEAPDSAGIESAYRDRYESPTGGQPFEEALAACRLHLAVQWLAWEPSWSPPQEHQRDWLAEAEREARLLGLG